MADLLTKLSINEDFARRGRGNGGFSLSVEEIMDSDRSDIEAVLSVYAEVGEYLWENVKRERARGNGKRTRNLYQIEDNRTGGPVTEYTF